MTEGYHSRFQNFEFTGWWLQKHSLPATIFFWLQVESDVIVTDVTEDVSSDSQDNVVLDDEVLSQTKVQENCSNGTSNSQNETGSSVDHPDLIENETSLSTSDTLQVKAEQLGTWH